MICKLSENPVDHFEWVVDTASVRMLSEELERPELVNVDRIEELVTYGFESNTLFVAEMDGEPVGVLGGLLVPNMFNPEIITLAEIFWYVVPDHRKSRAGALLIKAFQKKAEELGVESTMSLLHSSDINYKSLERLGFLPIEVGFLRRI